MSLSIPKRVNIFNVLNTLGILEGGVTLPAFCFNKTTLCFELTSGQDVTRVAGSPVTSVTEQGGYAWAFSSRVVRSVRTENILKLELVRERQVRNDLKAFGWGR